MKAEGTVGAPTCSLYKALGKVRLAKVRLDERVGFHFFGRKGRG
jgi:hypothetical protein